MGTLPPVTKWKMNVPNPAVNSAVAGLIPMSSGTSTVAPNATKRNCTPTRVFFVSDSCSVSILFCCSYFTSITRYLLVDQNICGLLMRSTYCLLASCCRVYELDGCMVRMRADLE